MESNALKINSLAELVSSIPHTLGFTPANSMVCLCFGDGPAARIDLPEPAEIDQWVEALTDVYLHRHHPRRLALVAFGQDGRRCIEALSVLADALGDGPRASGVEARTPEVGPVLWVDGDRWVDVRDGAEGVVDASSRARIDAEFAVRGRVMPLADREDLVAALQGNSDAAAAHLPDAEARLEPMDATALEYEAGWLQRRLEQFSDDRTYLSDTDAARVLALIQDPGARDVAVLGLSRANAPIFSELWHDLVRRAPETVRDTPATLLALSSFVEGRGAQAWVALDQLSTSNNLAGLVALALEQAIDPREWDTMLASSLSMGMQQTALRDSITRSSRRGHDPAQQPPGLYSSNPTDPTDPTDPAGPDTPEPGR